MKIGLGIGVTQPQNMPMASVGSPSYLFRDGAQGTWYDPSDINLTWRRNLLTYSEQFDNSAWWDKSGVYVSANASATTAPDGTLTSDLIYETATTSAHRIIQTVPGVASNVVLSAYVKSAGRQYFQLYTADTVSNFVTFDVVSGTITNTGSSVVSRSIQDVGNGWFKCSVAFSSNSAIFYFGLAVASNAAYSPSYTGDITKGIYIWGAQLEQGSTATPYQRITDGIQDYLQYQVQPVLYRDAAGTTPVTGVEQPVGLMLDKSKGLVLGSDVVVNGSFDTDTTWNKGSGWTISGGSAIASSAANINEVGVLTVGKWYLASVVVSTYTSGPLYVGTLSNLKALPTGTGTKTAIFLADATTLYMAGLGAFTGTIDNISVRELPGNHAFNSSGNSANFPVLSARYNLLTKSEQFDDAAWTKLGATIVANAEQSPDGALSADFLKEDTSTGLHLVYSTIPVTTGTSYTLSYWVKRAVGSRNIAMRLDNGDGTSRRSTIDLSTGTISANAAHTVTANLSGSYWYVTCRMTAVATTSVVVGAELNFAGVGSTYTGDGTSGIYIWGADLRVANDGVNLPAYQRVNTSTDYDTVGFKPYLRFNGTNQWLQTNSIDFTYGDKMFVSAGVRKLSDASFGMMVELSNSVGLANPGAFYLGVPLGSKYEFSSGRSTYSYATSAANSYIAPITNVPSGIGDISAPKSALRVNGTQAAISTADQGTGNYGNYPLYIGARAGSSLWFNGRLYGMVVAGKQVSAVEIDKTEDYIALKTGFTYPSISGVPTFMVVL